MMCIIQPIVKIQSKAREILTSNLNLLHIVPTRLPMIVRPKSYFYRGDRLINGGYLNNEVTYDEGLFIDRPLYENSTKLAKPNLIVGLVNGLNSVPYKINSDVMSYLNTHGYSKKLLIEPHEELAEYIRNPYKKRPLRLKKSLASEASKLHLQNNILNIAETYQNVAKLYFPVRLDQRTRIYSSAHYLNYQSTDLAKGLLTFAEGETLWKHDRRGIDCLSTHAPHG